MPATRGEGGGGGGGMGGGGGGAGAVLWYLRFFPATAAVLFYLSCYIDVNSLASLHATQVCGVTSPRAKCKTRAAI